MMKIKRFVAAVLAYVFMGAALQAQEMNWYDPLKAEGKVVEGQGWEGLGYQRLPEEAKDQVREPVWELSRNAAGLSISFDSDAAEIQVKFTPGPRLSMPHMPSTGVSGLDLYAQDETGAWLWVRGKYSFSEELVSYTFITPDSPTQGRRYRLYLPLYNRLTDLEIGVASDSRFDFVQAKAEAPIVVYGTSIAQGACASRPGMAWTNIVSRTLDRPLINLAFSGNGRLEPEVLDFIKTIDARIFILDCLPNLGPWGGFTESDVKRKLEESVATLKEAHPDTPILLVEHDGYSDGWIDEDRAKAYQDLNKWMKSVFERLQNEKQLSGIYLLTKEELGLGNEDFVDGTHPSDLGMQHYAAAYVKKLAEILD